MKHLRGDVRSSLLTVSRQRETHVKGNLRKNPFYIDLPQARETHVKRRSSTAGCRRRGDGRTATPHTRKAQLRTPSTWPRKKSTLPMVIFWKTSRVMYVELENSSPTACVGETLREAD